MKFMRLDRFEIPMILNSEIERLLNRERRAVVAIDGRAASGKSSLASALAVRYGGEVIHTDDFFLPFDMRSESRLSEPGGNIHYERFTDEVLNSLRRRDSFEYGVFDCKSGEIAKKTVCRNTGLVIVEGAYSLHPKFGKYYDLSIFMSAEYTTRLERIKKRDGEEKAKIFAYRWIPMEERYFETFGTERTADFLLSTDDIY